MLDKISASIILIASSPVLLIIAFLIWLDNHSAPIVSRQARIGQFEKSFIIFKFRTMMNVAESNSPVETRDDPRLTKIGKWLRSTHLDELPQLINVIQGDMKIIGPRPLMKSTHNKDVIRHGRRFTLRYQVKPGLVGAAQLYERASKHHRCALDHITLHNEHRLGFKIYILTRTLKQVIGLKGT